MIYLSFDIEEFDFPLERGVDIPLDEQISVSTEGLMRLLAMLKEEKVCATFFSTVIFAQQNPDLIKLIVEQGHELASHGHYHSQFTEAHYLSSKLALEELANTEILGFRAARMMPISAEKLLEAGYTYDSSINPTCIPGRYNNLRINRKAHYIGKLIEIPASVTPWIRFPLFWIAFHALPLSIYSWLAARSIKKNGYLNVYFHPWEFSEKLKEKRYNIPDYISSCSGNVMCEKLQSFIQKMKVKGYGFGKLRDIKP